MFPIYTCLIRQFLGDTGSRINALRLDSNGEAITYRTRPSHKMGTFDCYHHRYRLRDDSVVSARQYNILQDIACTLTVCPVSITLVLIYSSQRLVLGIDNWSPACWHGLADVSVCLVTDAFVQVVVITSNNTKDRSQ